MDPTLPPSSQPSEPSDDLMKPPSNLMDDPLMDDPLIEPVSSQTEIKPASEVVSEPSDDFVDLTNNITDSPDDSATVQIAVADAAKDTTDIPLDEPTEEFVDIFGSETEAPAEEVVIADVTVEPVTDKSEVASGAEDPPGDEKTGNNAEEEAKEPSTAPIMDLSVDSSATNEPQPLDSKIADPLVDLLSPAAPANDAKKPSKATLDLFEDEGSDLFAEPQPTKSAKQPQKSLFGDPDEDLFGEPLGATAKKTIREEQKDKSVTTKAAAVESNVGGPLQDSAPAESGDIFTEEAVATVPVIKNTSAVSPKTNGIHSEEETDIFSGRSTVFLNM